MEPVTACDWSLDELCRVVREHDTLGFPSRGRMSARRISDRPSRDPLVPKSRGEFDEEGEGFSLECAPQLHVVSRYVCVLSSAAGH